MSASPVRSVGLHCVLGLCLILGFASNCTAQAIAPPPPLVPLASAVYDTAFIVQATETQRQADTLETKHRLFEAMELFEKLIASAAELPPGLQHGYQFDVIMAASHLDAARTRIYHGESLHNLKAQEENRHLIIDHLNIVPGLVVAASKEVDADADRNKFKADAYKLLAAGQLYLGVVNGSTKDLEGSIKAYQKLAQTDPDASKEANRMISYVKSVERQMEGHIFSYDNVVKLSAAIVKEAVPKYGGWLAAGIELGADYYKKHRTEPVPPKAR